MRLIKIMWESTKRLFSEEYAYHASGLAYATLLSLVPLLSVIVSVLSIFPEFTKFLNLSQEFIIANFVPTSGALIKHYLEGFVAKATRLPTVGLIFLFVTAILLMMAVENTLNGIWGVKRKRKNILAILFYWIILFLTPLFIGLSVILSSYVFSLSWLSQVTAKLGLTVYLLAVLPLILNTIIFSLLYIIVPNYKVPLSDGFLGGLVAAILFELAKKGFAVYIIHLANYQLVYGALAAIPIFLLWLYVSWVIVLYGAIFTHVMHLKRSKHHSRH